MLTLTLWLILCCDVVCCSALDAALSVRASKRVRASLAAAAAMAAAAAAAAASVGAVFPVPRSRARLWIGVSPLDVMFFVMIWVGATAGENSCRAVAGRAGAPPCGLTRT